MTPDKTDPLLNLTDFAAIDFETANCEPTSACSIGVVIVRNGAIADSYYSLIQPEPNYYNYFCQRVHGISRQMTDSAPVFSEVWQEVAPLLEGLPLVAHNARFDKKVLESVMRCYQIEWPDYQFFDTLAYSRKAFRELPNHQLHTVSAHCGFDLKNHHHALADAVACAHIAARMSGYVLTGEIDC